MNMGFFETAAGKAITLETLKEMKNIKDRDEAQKLVQSLNDLWQVMTVIGMKDFHDENWIYHHKQVIGIDLALPYRSLRSEHPFDFLNHKHPSSGRSLTVEETLGLLQSIRPELRQFIRILTPEYLFKKADENGYEFKTNELEEILARVKVISNL